MSKVFVKCLFESTRVGLDWVVRCGGDEFLIVLPETDVPGARNMAKRLRDTIAHTVIETHEKRISIIASFGVAGFSWVTPQIEMTGEAMIKAAEEYLYQSKYGGRSIVVAGPISNEHSSLGEIQI